MIMSFDAIRSNSLKAVSSSDDELRVANYMVLFNSRDLEGLANTRKNRDGSRGEYFTKSTKFDSPYTDVGVLYVDWEHGGAPRGEPQKDDVLGYVDWKSARVDEKGLFVERVLNRRNKYVRFLEELIRERMIGTSSEAVDQGVEKAENGEIKSWPLRRDTLTVVPMEPAMITANSLSALKALSQRIDSLKSIVGQAELSRGLEVSESKTNAQFVDSNTGYDGDSDADARILSLELELLLL